MFMVFPLPLWALDKIYPNFHQIKEISLFKEILQKKNFFFLTILAAGCNTCICFKMVAPSLVMVTSPFPLWIYNKI